jgi:two-component system response regulator
MNQPVILLVEDDNNDEELAKLALQENSIRNELVVVRDGQEALDYLFAQGKYANRNPHDLPQVVMLDLKLPKLNGLEVLKALRQNERTKYLAVVVFTSSKEERDLLESYKLGANAFVQKPIDFAEFSSAVQQLGLFWVLWNKRAPESELGR